VRGSPHGISCFMSGKRNKHDSEDLNKKRERGKKKKKKTHKKENKNKKKHTTRRLLATDRGRSARHAGASLAHLRRVDGKWGSCTSQGGGPLQNRDIPKNGE